MTSHPTSPVRGTTRIARAGLAAGVAGLGLLTLAGCAAGQIQAYGAAPTTPDTSQSSGSTSTGGSASATYADGTYSTDAQYQAPSGMERVSVTITLQDGVVTDVTATGDATDREAAQFQDRFASGIASAVVGKDISGLSVTRVSGASLTSNGFNAALEQIRSEALV
jgi:uncharacterized protein with FMN-binding domain